MKLTEKAAYIKGLIDGLELDPKDKQTKVFKAVSELLAEMAEEVANLEQCYDDVCDQIDALDEDLAGVEDVIYDEDDDENDICTCGCDDAAYEVICPTCGTTIGLNEEDLGQGGMNCPKCGELLEFDYDEDELDGDDDEPGKNDEPDGEDNGES